MIQDKRDLYPKRQDQSGTLVLVGPTFVDHFRVSESSLDGMGDIADELDLMARAGIEFSWLPKYPVALVDEHVLIYRDRS